MLSKTTFIFGKKHHFNFFKLTWWLTAPNVRCDGHFIAKDTSSGLFIVHIWSGSSHFDLLWWRGGGQFNLVHSLL